jgi:hypothetical protein
LVGVGGGHAFVLQFNSSVESFEDGNKYQYSSSLNIIRNITFANDCITACFSPIRSSFVILGCHSGKVYEEDEFGQIESSPEEASAVTTQTSGIIAVSPA